MTTARAFTFDIWLTLLRSNPAFKAARNAMLHEVFAPNVPIEQFDTTLREQDRLADHISEDTGRDLGFTDRLALAMSVLGLELRADDARIPAAIAGQRRLALAFPPVPMSADLPELMADLVARYPVALLSNTGYLPGDLMRDLLVAAGFPQFTHYSFSNEVGASKPRAAIFHDALAGLRPALPDLTLADLLHIGDNANADVGGATALGLQAALVNVAGAPSTADLIRPYLLIHAAR